MYRNDTIHLKEETKKTLFINTPCYLGCDFPTLHNSDIDFFISNHIFYYFTYIIEGGNFNQRGFCIIKYIRG